MLGPFCWVGSTDNRFISLQQEEKKMFLSMHPPSRDLPSLRKSAGGGPESYMCSGSCSRPPPSCSPPAHHRSTCGRCTGHSDTETGPQSNASRSPSVGGKRAALVSMCSVMPPSPRLVLHFMLSISKWSLFLSFAISSYIRLLFQPRSLLTLTTLAIVKRTCQIFMCAYLYIILHVTCYTRAKSAGQIPCMFNLLGQ